MSNPFGLPDVGATITKAFNDIFTDIDPARTPLAYSVKAAGPGAIPAIGALVHAVAALELRLAEVERT